MKSNTSKAWIVGIVLLLVATVSATQIERATQPTAKLCATPVAGNKPAENAIQLCQALGPAAPHNIWSVDSAAGRGCGEVGWDSRGCGNWQSYAQGEYVGHARLPHVNEYRLRVGDQLAVYYLRTREVLSHPYQLQVGDMISIESLTADGGGGGGDISDPTATEPSTGGDDVNRRLIVQPDGTITLPLLGQVRAAGKSIPTLRDELEVLYEKFFKVPAITVTAINIDTRLQDLLDTVDSRGGILGGQQLQVVVTPAGRINLPGIGSVYVQGLSLDEARRELDARYAATIPGVRVTPDLLVRAQRFVYVLGEVVTPGQFELDGPTTVMQAIALAGGWEVGANLRQVVVFRRGEDWRLMATMVDLRGALYARRPVPADEIWLNDSDVILVPKTPIQMADEVISQVFTRGVYAAVPLELVWGQGFSTVSTIITQ